MCAAATRERVTLAERIASVARVADNEMRQGGESASLTSTAHDVAQQLLSPKLGAEMASLTTQDVDKVNPVSPRRHVPAVAYDCCCNVEQLVQDAGKGDVAALRRALAKGVDVNAKGNTNNAYWGVS